MLINLYYNYSTATLDNIKFINNIAQILYPLVVGAVTYVAYCNKSNISVNGWEALSKGFHYYWPIVKANIISGFKIVLGLILLIVPGLYFITKYSLYTAT
jgi:hypothetical protein